MSDDDDFMHALIGLGVWQNVAAARQQAEYQRQQLNLLRKHQGLAPIPPNPPDCTFAAWALFTMWAVGFGLGVGAGFWGYELLGDPWGWVVGVAATLWLFGRANEWFRRHVARREAAFYAAWRRAGCP